MATERLDIVVSENGSRLVVVNINKIGETAKKTGSSVDVLRGALQALGAYLSARQVLMAVDNYTRLQNQLKLATTSATQLAQVQQRLYTSAQRTGTSINAVSELYAKLSISSKELGASQNDLLKFTEGVSTALAIGGISAEQARGALLQLSQAMASPIVRAEEFNSVLEGAPTILRAVAQGMEGMEGSVAKLRLAVTNGEVTNKEFFNAFMSQLGVLDSQFGKVTLTLSSQLEKVQNAFIMFVGEMDKSLGASKTLGNLLAWIAENMDTVAKTAIAIGVGLAAAFTPVVVGWIAAAATALFSVAGGITALIAATAGLVVFSDQIVVLNDNATTLKSVFEAFMFEIGPGLDSVFSALGVKFEELSKVFESAWGDITFEDTLRENARQLDAIVGAMMAVKNAAVVIWENIGQVIKEKTIDGVNGAITGIENLLNSIVMLQNKLRELMGLDPMQLIDLPRLENTAAGSGEQLGVKLGEAIQQGLAYSGVTQSLERTLSLAQVIEDDKRRFGAKLTPGTDALAGAPASKPNTSVDEGAVKRLKKEASELDSLVRSIDRVSDAKQNLTEAEQIFNREVDKGSIGRERANQLMDVYSKQLQDQLDPLGKINKELQIEADSYNLTKEAREINVELLQYEQELLQAGIVLKQQDADAIKLQLQNIQALNKADQKRQEFLDKVKQTYEDLNAPVTSYSEKLKILNTLLNQGKITQEQYLTATRDALIEYLDTQNDVESGVRRALLKMQREYSDFASIVENTITNAFSALEDVFVRFAQTGKLSFKDFANSVIADFTRMSYRMLSSSLFGSGGVLSGLFEGLFSTGAAAIAGGPGGSSFGGSGLGVGSMHIGTQGGSNITTRNVSPAAFIGAPRFHSGSFGLGVGEMAAILKKDEKVYTPQQDKAIRGKTEINIYNNNSRAGVRTEESQDNQGNQRIDVYVDELTAQALRNPSSKTSRTMRERLGTSNVLVNR